MLQLLSQIKNVYIIVWTINKFEFYLVSKPFGCFFTVLSVRLSKFCSSVFEFILAGIFRFFLYKIAASVNEIPDSLENALAILYTEAMSSCSPVTCAILGVNVVWLTN